MGRFTLITGGSRSGKSDFALKVGEKHGRNRVFLATARVTDSEMADRIRKHKTERGATWETREESANLVSLLRTFSEQTDVVVIDCITVFVSNLMIENKWDDSDILGEVEALASVIQDCPFPVIVVTNEVGMGLVPVEPLGRRFRDVAGVANQRLAAAADEVFLVAAGIPLCLKARNDSGSQFQVHGSRLESDED